MNHPAKTTHNNYALLIRRLWNQWNLLILFRDSLTFDRLLFEAQKIIQNRLTLNFSIDLSVANLTWIFFLGVHGSLDRYQNPAKINYLEKIVAKRAPDKSTKKRTLLIIPSKVMWNKFLWQSEFDIKWCLLIFIKFNKKEICPHESTLFLGWEYKADAGFGMDFNNNGQVLNIER